MPALTPLLRRGLLYVLLVLLGAISLLWNLIASILYLLIPKRPATVLGRAVIGRVYGVFWATAQSLGMLHIDAAALALLRDEPGGLIIAANHPTMLDALRCRAPAARRLHHEGRPVAQPVPRRGRAARHPSTTIRRAA
jgi:hypothetical protein